MTSWRFVAAVALLAVSWSSAGAQELRLGVRGGQVSDETGVVHTGATIAPELRWAGGGWATRMGVTGTVLRSGGVIGGATAEGEAALWKSGPVAVVMAGFGAAAASDLGYRAAALGLSPGVRLASGAISLEARALFQGGAAGHPESRSDPGLLPLSGRGSAGGGMIRQEAVGAGAAASVATGPLTSRVEWRRMQTTASDSWTDWTGKTRLDAGRVVATAMAGRRAGVAAGIWGAVSVELRLTPGLGAAISLGRQAADPLTRRASGNFATVGMELIVPGGGASPAAPPRPPVPIDGTTRIVLRAERGARVELLADWNDWQPQAVPEAAPGVYRIDMDLSPGTYRFALRVNGRWELPPEYESEPDEFGGRRAVLRVAGS